MKGLERWKGKVALVTGASAGIGEAVARALGEAGLRVVLAARRQERLEALAKEMAPAQTLCVSCDLSQAGEVPRLFGVIRKEWGGTDVLINNAGLGRRQLFKEGDESAWQQMIDVNIRAAALCMREALKDFEGRQDAAIINISSLAGHRILGGRGATFYGATKHALRALTDGIRMELVAEKSPVKIGMISPGLVVSEFHEVADAGKGWEYPHEPLVAEDLAEGVLWMLSRPRHVQISDILMRSVSQPG